MTSAEKLDISAIEPTKDGYCPPIMLSQPAELRYKWFEARLVGHDRLEDVTQQVMNVVSSPAGVTTLLVVGPAGVGKSTLRHKVAKKILDLAAAQPEAFVGRIPVIDMSLPMPESGSWNWKDHYTRFLIAADEPLIQYKIDYGVHELKRDARGRLIIPRSVTLPDLRRAVENCLTHRRPMAVIHDEAQHILKMASGKRYHDQMDVIKSLADMTKTLHILIGPYELLDLANLSSQLARRTQEIHFSPYTSAGKADRDSFNKALSSFQRLLPLAEPSDLLAHRRDFFLGSVGCVGILKAWLNRALNLALQMGANSLSMDVIAKTRLSDAKLVTMARDIREGTEMFKSRGADKELRLLLGLDKPKKKLVKNSVRPGRQVGQKARPGTRNPTRDTVGPA